MASSGTVYQHGHIMLQLQLSMKSPLKLHGIGHLRPTPCYGRDATQDRWCQGKVPEESGQALGCDGSARRRQLADVSSRGPWFAMMPARCRANVSNTASTRCST